MSELLKMKFIPCSIDTHALDKDAIDGYLKKLNKDWNVLENKSIKKIYKFKDSKEALVFTNKIKDLVEE